MFRNSLLIVSALGLISVSACGDAGSTDAVAPIFGAPATGNVPPPTGVASTPVGTMAPPPVVIPGAGGTPPVGAAGAPGVTPVGAGGVPGVPPVGTGGVPGVPPVGAAGAPGVPPVGAAVPPPPAGFGATVTMPFVGDFAGTTIGQNSGPFLPGNAFPMVMPTVAGGVGTFVVPFTALNEMLVWNFRVTPTSDLSGMEAVVGLYLANGSLEPAVYGIAVGVTATSDDPATPIVGTTGEEFAFLGEFYQPSMITVGQWTEFTLDLDKLPENNSLFSPLSVNQIGFQIDSTSATTPAGIVSIPTNVTVGVAFAGFRLKGTAPPPMGTAGMGAAGMGMAGMGVAGMGVAGMDMGVGGMDMGVGGMAGAGM